MPLPRLLEITFPVIETGGALFRKMPSLRLLRLLGVPNASTGASPPALVPMALPVMTIGSSDASLPLPWISMPRPRSPAITLLFESPIEPPPIMRPPALLSRIPSRTLPRLEPWVDVPVASVPRKFPWITVLLVVSRLDVDATDPVRGDDVPQDRGLGAVEDDPVFAVARGTRDRDIRREAACVGPDQVVTQVVHKRGLIIGRADPVSAVVADEVALHPVRGGGTGLVDGDAVLKITIDIIQRGRRAARQPRRPEDIPGGTRDTNANAVPHGLGTVQARPDEVAHDKVVCRRP